MGEKHSSRCPAVMLTLRAVERKSHRVSEIHNIIINVKTRKHLLLGAGDVAQIYKWYIAFLSRSCSLEYVLTPLWM